MDTFQHLDELIEAGYGDIPQTQIPVDWRTRRPALHSFAQTEHPEQLRVPQQRRKRRTYAELRADRLVWDKPPSRS